MFVRLLPVGGTQGLSKVTCLYHFPPLSLAPSPLFAPSPPELPLAVLALWLWAEPNLHFSALVPWPMASLPPPPGPLLICNVARGSAPCLPGVNMVVSPGKNQNGSQMIVGQQVAEEESLPSSRGTPTPWLMLGSDFDLYLFLGCQSYIV